MTVPSSAPPSAVRFDRACGAVLASAAGDALGAPHEFGPALPGDTPLAMTGGGALHWGPGEWTDDTQQALAVLTPLADASRCDDVVREVEDGLRRWFAAGPNDVGSQTRQVLARDRQLGIGLAEAAAELQRRRPDSAGNGSLMRTGPVALAHLGDLDAVAALAAELSALTHPHPDAVDACVLWTVAVARAIDGPTDGSPDWVGLVEAGLDHVDPARRDEWRARLAACRTAPPESFTPNGWVVAALQAALASLAQTEVPAGEPPCAHLRLSIERAVRIGDDADTVAAIAGALAGAHWGATAVPYGWRRPLHGELTKVSAPRTRADLDRLARLAANEGRPGPHGWPGVATLLPHYEAVWPADPLAVAVVEGVTVGNVHAVPTQVRQVDAVVSLCRMGTDDVPQGVEHHVIGLIDQDPAQNPNLDFVLADTCDLVAALVEEGKRVFVHCVQAENRTPAVGAAFLVRHRGVDPAEALERVGGLVGGPRQPFLVDAVHRVHPA